MKVRERSPFFRGYNDLNRDVGKVRRVAVTYNRKYRIDELPALLDRLAHQPASIEETERRRKLSDEADRIRNAMAPIPVSVEELIRQEQETDPLG